MIEKLAARMEAELEASFTQSMKYNKEDDTFTLDKFKDAFIRILEPPPSSIFWTERKPLIDPELPYQIGGLKIIIKPGTDHIGSWIFKRPRWYQWLASKLGLRAWTFTDMHGTYNNTMMYRTDTHLFVTEEQYQELRKQYVEPKKQGCVVCDSII